MGCAARTALNKMLPSYTVTPDSRGPARLLAFKLGGKVQLPKATRFVEHFEKPPLPRFDPKLASVGRLLYPQRGCDLCHGENAIGGYGSVPDLRKASAETHELIGGIVIDGLKQDRGMPSFKDAVTPEELQTIQAFIINQAWDAYEAQKTK